MPDRKRSCHVAVAAILVFAGAGALAAEPVPQATKAILKNLNLTDAVLKGLEPELAVPQEILDGAKREGRLRVRANLSAEDFNKLAAPFKERYPFIAEIQYTRGIGMNRAVNPLVAFKRGSYVTDAITSFTEIVAEYKASNALEDLRGLPGWKNVPDGSKSPDGIWIATQNSHWCMAYNTKRVKQSELPKTWDELVESPRWRNGKIGMGNRPQLWMITLWADKGPEYGKKYIQKLFEVAKPQLRKEAINGLMKLAVLGEFDIALPAADYRVKLEVNKGAPLAFYCPAVVPTTESQIGVFRNAPNVNAAKLFVNWLSSREGQLALNNADGSSPVHKDLQRDEFLAYPKEVLTKRKAIRSIEATNEELPKMYEVWNAAWAKAGGPKER